MTNLGAHLVDSSTSLTRCSGVDAGVDFIDSICLAIIGRYTAVNSGLTLNSMPS